MSSFSFKQFTIKQDQCAMKVSLDACLLGALCEVNPGALNGEKRVLDIGTGTGLLTLMLAQRSSLNVQFDAIELDHKAYEQAKINVSNSPFKQEIHIHQGAIQDYFSEHQYDLIICNPPFFSNQLKADDPARNMARHNHALSFQDLSSAINLHLNEDGIAWLLLPLSERQGFEEAAAGCGLYVERDWHIQATPNKPVKMTIFTLKKAAKNTVIKPSKIRVYDDNNQYTEGFRQLLADYYLKL